MESRKNRSPEELTPYEWTQLSIAGIALAVLVLLLVSFLDEGAESESSLSPAKPVPQEVNPHQGIEGDREENNIKEINDTIAANVQLAMDPRLNPLSIDVDSEDGIVTLQGDVESVGKKKLAENLVEDVVRGRVVNELDVTGRSIRVSTTIGTWVIRLMLVFLLLLLGYVALQLWLARSEKESREPLKEALFPRGPRGITEDKNIEEES